MENSPIRSYLGSFFCVILTVLLLTGGALEIANFIRANKPTFITVIGAPFSGAVAFVAGYFVNVFGFPSSMKILRRAAIPVFIWGMLLLVFIVLLGSNQDYPIGDFFASFLSYSLAGMFLAWASNYFRTTKKT